MMIKIAACLLTLGLFAACQTTTTTAKRETLREQQARYVAAETGPSSTNGPAPVAEGPEDVPSNQSSDPDQNPALVPTPLLRTSAAGGL
jgi:hypothetical protein